MGMIHFANDFQEQTLEALLGAHDCMEVVRDLNRIEAAKVFGSYIQACQLDDDLRKRYPTIDIFRGRCQLSVAVLRITIIHILSA